MHQPQDDVVPLHEPFETALRGFNRQQVLAHVESLEGQIAMISSDRESALRQLAELSRVVDHLRGESELLTHLRREAERANEEMELMHRAPMVAASSRIQHIVRMAEEEIAELKDRAQQETDELRARAKAEIDELLAQAEQDAAAHRKRACDESDALLRHMTQRCNDLEVESEKRRRAAEQEAEQEIAQKKSEADELIRLRGQRSITGLQLMLKIVGQQLTDRVSAVEWEVAELTESRERRGQEVAALEDFRARITTQLSVTHQVLTGALDQVQHSTAETEDPPPPRPALVQHHGHPAAEQTTNGETAQSASSRTGERHQHPATSA